MVKLDQSCFGLLMNVRLLYGDGIVSAADLGHFWSFGLWLWFYFVKHKLFFMVHVDLVYMRGSQGVCVFSFLVLLACC